MKDKCINIAMTAHLFFLIAVSLLKKLLVAVARFWGFLFISFTVLHKNPINEISKLSGDQCLYITICGAVLFFTVNVFTQFALCDKRRVVRITRRTIHPTGVARIKNDIDM